MDDISEGVRKPAVSLTSRANFLNTGLNISSMGACYPGDESLLLPRNHTLNNIIYSGNISFPDNRIKSQDSSCLALFSDSACEDRMDQIFLSYPQANGVPQESKLATYMNRQTTNTPTNNLTANLAGLSLDHSSLKKVTPQAPEFVPSSNALAGGTSSPSFLNSFSNLVATQGFSARRSSVESPISPRITPQHSPPITNCSPTPNLPHDTTKLTPVSTYQENVGGTTYFYPTTNAAATGESPPAIPPLVLPTFQVYPGTPTHISSLKGKPAPAAGFYVQEEIRQELLLKNAITLSQPDPEQHPDLPNEIDNYHQLCPLKPSSGHKSLLLGYPMSTYKATNIKTGVRYFLRRVHGYRLPNTKCMVFVDMWKRLQHSNIIPLREVFTTKAFGDYSMIFVYDFHPGSETLLAKHFDRSADQHNGFADPFTEHTNSTSRSPYSSGHSKVILFDWLSMDPSSSMSPGVEGYPGFNSFAPGVNAATTSVRSQMLPEASIWNYIIQLTAALRVIHAAGLACRTLDPTKIVLTGNGRIQLSCVGISDVLTFDSSAPNPLHLVPHYQQEDLTALGKVVLALACRSLLALQRENIQSSIEIVSRNYSNDLRNLIMYLLSNQPGNQQAGQHKSVTDLMPMIGARFYTQLDALQLRSDVLENELTKELENGRLARLLVKMGTINERPEFNLDPAWSETGDRYMLKLFRDYLFHQVQEDGRPWIDMAHIIQCLNKLDAGAPEKICLVSRDEQSILVVSYAELKHCLEQSFGELQSAANKNVIS